MRKFLIKIALVSFIFVIIFGFVWGMSLFMGKNLQKINFPSNPTKANLRIYVLAIVKASKDQKKFSFRDPQIQMLEKVGDENLDVLIDCYPKGRCGDYYFSTAIQKLASEKNKNLILEKLSVNNELVRVVRHCHWQRDAKATLLKNLDKDYLPPDWIEAIADLKDPETYDSLIKYFTFHENPWMTYESIKDLPDIKLGSAVDLVWANLLKRSYLGALEGIYMGCIAVEYGHLDALDFIVEKLDSPEAAKLSANEEIRKAILLYTEASGSNEELKAWYKANKGNLIFDSTDKKFKVKSAQTPASPQ